MQRSTRHDHDQRTASRFRPLASGVAAAALALTVLIATPTAASAAPAPIAVKDIRVGGLIGSSDASRFTTTVYGSSSGPRQLFVSARTTTIKISSNEFKPDNQNENYLGCDVKNSAGDSILTAPFSSESGVASGVVRLSVRVGAISLLNNRSYTATCYSGANQGYEQQSWRLTTKFSVGSVISLTDDPAKAITKQIVSDNWGTEEDSSAELQPGGRVRLLSTVGYWRPQGVTSFTSTVQLGSDTGTVPATNVTISPDASILSFDVPSQLHGGVDWTVTNSWVDAVGSSTTPRVTTVFTYDGRVQVAE